MGELIMTAWWQALGALLFLGVFAAMGWCVYDAMTEHTEAAE